MIIIMIYDCSHLLLIVNDQTLAFYLINHYLGSNTTQ